MTELGMWLLQSTEIFGIHMDEAIKVMMAYWLFSALTEAGTKAFGDMDNRGVKFVLTFLNLLSGNLKQMAEKYSQMSGKKE
ncbi:MAG: hypothetical protein V3W37_09150 [Candidatus Binatia bacterium]